MHTSPYAQAASCAVVDPEAMVAISREDIAVWVVNRLSECTGLDPQDIEVD